MKGVFVNLRFSVNEHELRLENGIMQKMMNAKFPGNNQMKKDIIIILILATLLAIATACSVDTNRNNSENENTSAVPLASQKPEIKTKVVFSYTKYEPENEELIPCFSIEDCLSENILRYSYTFEEVTTYGFMDTEFNILYLPELIEPSIFTNGLTVNYRVGDKKVVVLNTDMEEIDVDPRWPFKYEDNWYYKYVEKPREETRMDGKPAYTLRLSIEKYKNIDVHSTLVPVYKPSEEKKQLLWGFKTFHDAYIEPLPREDGFVIAPIYAEVREFNDGLAAVKREDKWEYINENGDVAINNVFDIASDFQNGVAFVGEINKEISVGNAYGYNWALMDSAGNILTEAKYGSDSQFENGYARVSVWGGGNNLLSIDGNEVFAETYPYLKLSEDGYVLARGQEGYYYFDLGGNRLNGEFYEFAKPFSEGLAAVTFGSYWGYIGTDGLMEIEPQYQSADLFMDGFALVKKSDKSFLVDRDGNQYLAELNLTKISKFNEDGYALAYSEEKKENETERIFYVIHREGLH